MRVMRDARPLSSSTSIIAPDMRGGVFERAGGGEKGVGTGGKKPFPHKVRHRHINTAGGLPNDFSFSGIAGRVVRRADHMLVVLVVVDEILFVPDVIAGRVG